MGALVSNSMARMAATNAEPQKRKEVPVDASHELAHALANFIGATTRSFSRACREGTMPSAAATRATWDVYEGEPLAPDTRLEWGRPCTEAVATMLAMHCGHRKEDTLRYLLPALLVHDLRNCDDTRAQFAPTGVEGECAVGARAMAIKPLAVLHWDPWTD